MKQLSGQDSQFLYMESDRNLSNVAMASVYAPPGKRGEDSLFELLKSHVESRLHTSPIFKRKLVRVPLDLDFPYWAEDEFFDLDGHLYRHRISGRERWGEFCELMGRVYSRPLDMNRPLWEMHLVENLGGVREFPEGSFAVITKLHHAAVDGAATMRFFGCLSDRDAKGTPAGDITGEV
jgi:diacylglycerol O-acyltransferase / wax synthase